MNFGTVETLFEMYVREHLIPGQQQSDQYANVTLEANADLFQQVLARIEAAGLVALDAVAVSQEANPETYQAQRDANGGWKPLCDILDAALPLLREGENYAEGAALDARALKSALIRNQAYGSKTLRQFTRAHNLANPSRREAVLRNQFNPDSEYDTEDLKWLTKLSGLPHIWHSSLLEIQGGSVLQETLCAAMKAQASQGATSYRLPICLSDSSALESRGTHWVALVLTVDPKRKTLQLRSKDSFPLADDAKVAMQATLSAALQGALVSLKEEGRFDGYTALRTDVDCLLPGKCQTSSYHCMDYTLLHLFEAVCPDSDNPFVRAMLNTNGDQAALRLATLEAILTGLEVTAEEYKEIEKENPILGQLALADVTAEEIPHYKLKTDYVAQVMSALSFRAGPAKSFSLALADIQSSIEENANASAEKARVASLLQVGPAVTKTVILDLDNFVNKHSISGDFQWDDMGLNGCFYRLSQVETPVRLELKGLEKYFVEGAPHLEAFSKLFYALLPLQNIVEVTCPGFLMDSQAASVLRLFELANKLRTADYQKGFAAELVGEQAFQAALEGVPALAVSDSNVLTVNLSEYLKKGDSGTRCLAKLNALMVSIKAVLDQDREKFHKVIFTDWAACFHDASSVQSDQRLLAIFSHLACGVELDKPDTEGKQNDILFKSIAYIGSQVPFRAAYRSDTFADLVKPVTDAESLILDDFSTVLLGDSQYSVAALAQIVNAKTPPCRKLIIKSGVTEENKAFLRALLEALTTVIRLDLEGFQLTSEDRAAFEPVLARNAFLAHAGILASDTESAWEHYFIARHKQVLGTEFTRSSKEISTRHFLAQGSGIPSQFDSSFDYHAFNRTIFNNPQAFLKAYFKGAESFAKTLSDVPMRLDFSMAYVGYFFDTVAFDRVFTSEECEQYYLTIMQTVTEQFATEKPFLFDEIKLSSTPFMTKDSDASSLTVTESDLYHSDAYIHSLKLLLSTASHKGQPKRITLVGDDFSSVFSIQQLNALAAFFKDESIQVMLEISKDLLKVPAHYRALRSEDAERFPGIDYSVDEATQLYRGITNVILKNQRESRAKAYVVDESIAPVETMVVTEAAVDARYVLPCKLNLGGKFQPSVDTVAEVSVSVQQQTATTSTAVGESVYMETASHQSISALDPDAGSAKGLLSYHAIKNMEKIPGFRSAYSARYLVDKESDQARVILLGFDTFKRLKLVMGEEASLDGTLLEGAYFSEKLLSEHSPDRFQKSINALSCEAFQAMTAQQHLFEGGIHIDNLPAGFLVREYSHAPGQVKLYLDYKIDEPVVEKTPLTPVVSLRTVVDDLGDLRQFLSDEKVAEYQEKFDTSDLIARKGFRLEKFQFILEANNPVLAKRLWQDYPWAFAEGGLFKANWPALFQLLSVFRYVGAEGVGCFLASLDALRGKAGAFNAFVGHFIAVNTEAVLRVSFVEIASIRAMDRLSKLSDIELNVWHLLLKRHFKYNDQGYSSTGFNTSFLDLFTAYEYFLSQISPLTLPEDFAVEDPRCDNMLTYLDRVLLILEKAHPHNRQSQLNVIPRLPMGNQDGWYAARFNGYHFVHPSMKLSAAEVDGGVLYHDEKGEPYAITPEALMQLDSGLSLDAAKVLFFRYLATHASTFNAKAYAKYAALIDAINTPPVDSHPNALRCDTHFILSCYALVALATTGARGMRQLDGDVFIAFLNTSTLLNEDPGALDVESARHLHVELLGVLSKAGHKPSLNEMAGILRFVHSSSLGPFEYALSGLETLDLFKALEFWARNPKRASPEFLTMVYADIFRPDISSSKLTNSQLVLFFSYVVSAEMSAFDLAPKLLDQLADMPNLLEGFLQVFEKVNVDTFSDPAVASRFTLDNLMKVVEASKAYTAKAELMSFLEGEFSIHSDRPVSEKVVAVVKPSSVGVFRENLSKLLEASQADILNAFLLSGGKASLVLEGKSLVFPSFSKKHPGLEKEYASVRSCYQAALNASSTDDNEEARAKLQQYKNEFNTIDQDYKGKQKAYAAALESHMNAHKPALMAALKLDSPERDVLDRLDAFVAVLRNEQVKVKTPAGSLDINTILKFISGELTGFQKAVGSVAGMAIEKIFSGNAGLMNKPGSSDQYPSVLEALRAKLTLYVEALVEQSLSAEESSGKAIKGFLTAVFGDTPEFTYTTIPQKTRALVAWFERFEPCLPALQAFYASWSGQSLASAFQFDFKGVDFSRLKSLLKVSGEEGLAQFVAVLTLLTDLRPNHHLIHFVFNVQPFTAKEDVEHFVSVLSDLHEGVDALLSSGTAVSVETIEYIYKAILSSPVMRGNQYADMRGFTKDVSAILMDDSLSVKERALIVEKLQGAGNGVGIQSFLQAYKRYSTAQAKHKKLVLSVMTKLIASDGMTESDFKSALEWMTLFSDGSPVVSAVLTVFNAQKATVSDLSKFIVEIEEFLSSHSASFTQAQAIEFFYFLHLAECASTVTANPFDSNFVKDVAINFDASQLALIRDSLFALPPYPTTRSLMQFINLDGEALSNAIQAFDRDPSGEFLANAERYFTKELNEELPRVIAELKILHGTHERALLPSEQTPLWAALVYVNDQSRVFTALSSSELKEQFMSLSQALNESKEKDGDATRQTFLTLVALLREIYRRTSSKQLFPRLTQLLPLILSADGNALANIDTGEGKTVIVALVAVLKQVTGGSVEVATSDPVLAAEGWHANKTFFDFLDIPSALVGDGAPFEDYQQGGINYGDYDSLALFTEKYELMLSLDPDRKVHIIADEFDKFAFFRTSTSKFAANLTGFSESPYKELYLAAFSFVTQPSFTVKRHYEEDIKLFKRYLISDCSGLELPSEIDVYQLLNNAFEAFQILQLPDEHYEMLVVEREVDGLTVSMFDAGVLTEEGRSAPANTRFSGHTHAIMHAVIAAQIKKRHAVEAVKGLKAFCESHPDIKPPLVPAMRSTLAEMNTNAWIQHTLARLEGGEIFAVTGTLKSEKLGRLEKALGAKSVKIPPHVRSKLAINAVERKIMASGVDEAAAHQENIQALQHQRVVVRLPFSTQAEAEYCRTILRGYGLKAFTLSKESDAVVLSVLPTADWTAERIIAAVDIDDAQFSAFERRVIKHDPVLVFVKTRGKGEALHAKGGYDLGGQAATLYLHEEGTTAQARYAAEQPIVEEIGQSGKVTITKFMGRGTDPKPEFGTVLQVYVADFFPEAEENEWVQRIRRTARSGAEGGAKICYSESVFEEYGFTAPSPDSPSYQKDIQALEVKIREKISLDQGGKWLITNRHAAVLTQLHAGFVVLMQKAKRLFESGYGVLSKTADMQADWHIINQSAWQQWAKFTEQLMQCWQAKEVDLLVKGKEDSCGPVEFEASLTEALESYIQTAKNHWPALREAVLEAVNAQYTVKRSGVVMDFTRAEAAALTAAQKQYRKTDPVRIQADKVALEEKRVALHRCTALLEAITNTKTELLTKRFMPAQEKLDRLLSKVVPEKTSGMLWRRGKPRPQADIDRDTAVLAQNREAARLALNNIQAEVSTKQAELAHAEKEKRSLLSDIERLSVSGKDSGLARNPSATWRDALAYGEAYELAPKKLLLTDLGDADELNPVTAEPVEMVSSFDVLRQDFFTGGLAPMSSLTASALIEGDAKNKKAALLEVFANLMLEKKCSLSKGLEKTTGNYITALLPVLLNRYYAPSVSKKATASSPLALARCKRDYWHFIGAIEQFGDDVVKTQLYQTHVGYYNALLSEESDYRYMPGTANEALLTAVRNDLFRQMLDLSDRGLLKPGEADVLNPGHFAQNPRYALRGVSGSAAVSGREGAGYESILKGLLIFAQKQIRAYKSNYSRFKSSDRRARLSELSGALKGFAAQAESGENQLSVIKSLISKVDELSLVAMDDDNASNQKAWRFLRNSNVKRGSRFQKMLSAIREKALGSISAEKDLFESQLSTFKLMAEEVLKYRQLPKLSQFSAEHASLFAALQACVDTTFSGDDLPEAFIALLTLKDKLAGELEGAERDGLRKGNARAVYHAVEELIDRIAKFEAATAVSQLRDTVAKSPAVVVRNAVRAIAGTAKLSAKVPSELQADFELYVKARYGAGSFIGFDSPENLKRCFELLYNLEKGLLGLDKAAKFVFDTAVLSEKGALTIGYHLAGEENASEFTVEGFGRAISPVFQSYATHPIEATEKPQAVMLKERLAGIKAEPILTVTPKLQEFLSEFLLACEVKGINIDARGGTCRDRVLCLLKDKRLDLKTLFVGLVKLSGGSKKVNALLEQDSELSQAIEVADLFKAVVLAERDAHSFRVIGQLTDSRFDGALQTPEPSQVHHGRERAASLPLPADEDVPNPDSSVVRPASAGRISNA